MKTNTFRNFSIFTMAAAILLLAFLPVAPAFAALNTIATTTLSSALTSTSPFLYLTSISGVNGPSQPVSQGSLGPPSGASWTILYVDTEAIRVTATPTAASAPVLVERGWDGTIAQPHASGALTYVSQPAYFARVDQFGACTAATQFVLPVINSVSGRIFDCRTSGQWIQVAEGTMNPTPKGGLFSAFCTGTVGSAETEYLVGAACSGATTSTARYLVPTLGTIASLRVISSAGVTGGTGKDVLTVFKNGSGTTLTCTMGAAATTCNDFTDSVAVAAGDILTFQFVTATSDTAANIAVSLAKY